jgi:hypothetical protein
MPQRWQLNKHSGQNSSSAAFRAEHEKFPFQECNGIDALFWKL